MTATEPAAESAPAATSGYATISDLFRPRLEETDYPIPGVGKVRIRALSRLEVLEVRGKTLPMVEVERRLVSMAMLAPTMTYEQVKDWQGSSGAGELEDLTRVIMRMSRLQEGADKAAVAAFRG